MMAKREKRESGCQGPSASLAKDEAESRCAHAAGGRLERGSAPCGRRMRAFRPLPSSFLTAAPLVCLKDTYNPGGV